MRCVSGTFNGTGATLYLCIGFIPDWVKVWNLENAEDYEVYWSKNFRANERVNGVLWDGDDNADFNITPAAGGTALIAPYKGQDVMSSSNQTSTTYGEGVYLTWDGYDGGNLDYRTEGAGDTIDTWTLDTSGNRTGHWNAVCNTTYIGEGSRILIDGVWYTVVALTSNGEQSDEVTLNSAAATGDITFISGMYDMVPVAIGDTTPAGFSFGNTTVNANDELCMFEAGTYDRSGY